MLLKEMRELVEELNIYAHAYYMEDTSLISDYEYDKKYDRLKELEKVTGIILANSPTINVGMFLMCKNAQRCLESGDKRTRM